MSGTNPLLAQGAPAPTPSAPVPPMPAASSQPAAPNPIQPHQMGHLVSGAMRGSPQVLMARRDAAGPELAILARVMNEPDPKPQEVIDYIVSAAKSGQVQPGEAIQIVQSIPKDDPNALRAWARQMFNAVMHVGIHAHAAFPRQAFPGAAAAPQDDSAAANGGGPPP